MHAAIPRTTNLSFLFSFFLTLQTGDLTGFDFAIYEMYPFNPLFAVAFGQHVLSR